MDNPLSRKQLEEVRQVVAASTVVEGESSQLSLVALARQLEAVRQAEFQRCRAAVADLHHGQIADDRCFEDDDRLYSWFGLPAVDRTIGDPQEMHANCWRFIQNRCQAGGPWRSYRELLEEADQLRQTIRTMQVAAAEQDVRLEEQRTRLASFQRERAAIVRLIGQDGWARLQARRHTFITRRVYQDDLTADEQAEFECLQQLSHALVNLAFEWPIDNRQEMLDLQGRILREMTEKVQRLEGELKSAQDSVESWESTARMLEEEQQTIIQNAPLEREAQIRADCDRKINESHARLQEGVSATLVARLAEVRMALLREADRYLSEDGQPGDLASLWGYRDIATTIRRVVRRLLPEATP